MGIFMTDKMNVPEKDKKLTYLDSCSDTNDSGDKENNIIDDNSEIITIKENQDLNGCNEEEKTEYGGEKYNGEASVADVRSVNENGVLQERGTKYKNLYLNLNEGTDMGVKLSNNENYPKDVKMSKSSLKPCNSKKKSKTQIKEERLKIQSETHRLMREREISIPYHLPKQRTLKEFLSRKKNRAHIPLNTPSSKMLEIWRDIEESTRSAFEFFKSDSDSDSETLYEVSKNDTLEAKNDSSYVTPTSQSTNNTLYIENNCNNSNNEKINDFHDLKSQITNSDSKNPNYNQSNFSGSENLEQLENKKDETDIVGQNEDDIYLDKTEKKRSVENNLTVDDESCESVSHLSHLEVSSNNHATIKTNHEKVLPLILDDSEERGSDWVKNIQEYEKELRQKKKEILLKKLNPKLLKMVPKLSGEPNSFIDLENRQDTVEVGAKILKKRFLENCVVPKQKTMKEVELTITTSDTNEKGEIIALKSEKLMYNSSETLCDRSLDKPGAKLQKLREELKKKIEEKWEEEHKKKTQEYLSEAVKEKQVADEDEILDDEEEFSSEVESSDSEESSEDEESELEDDIVNEGSAKKKNQFIDSEAEESGAEGGDELDYCDEEIIQDCAVHDSTTNESSRISNKDCGFDYDSQRSLIPPYQPGGGMLNGGSELTQCEDDSTFPKNIFSPALGLSLELSPSEKDSNKSTTQQIWDADPESPEENVNRNFMPYIFEQSSYDLNDAYEFCSGKFPDTRLSQTNTESQELVCTEDSELETESAKNLEVKRCEKELPNEDDCGGGKKKKNSRIKIMIDESDEETPQQVNDLNDLKYSTTRILSEDSESDSEKTFCRTKRAIKHLQFSDDDEDLKSDEEEKGSGGEIDCNEDCSNEDVGSVDQDVNKEVVYNSEEEEVVQNAGDFFENEAELSGDEDEWSGDEDEKDLDKMEEEDGDADNIDEKKVRSELEKIHMRTLLDDDERHVRLLQELLFEDGDLFDDGPKRQKNFRWKNLEGNFFEDDEKDQDVSEAQCQDEIEEDEQVVKTRHEKELFLMQLKNKSEVCLDDDDDDDGKSLLKLGRVILEQTVRHTYINKTKIGESSKKDAEEIIDKSPLALLNKRGSFLSRNEEFLSRLAKFTSNATDNILGPKHSKNFVFTSKTPEKTDSARKENSNPKRKNDSSKNEGHRSKKLKLEKRTNAKKASVLDRLT